jgi:hypothetical protein
MDDPQSNTRAGALAGTVVIELGMVMQVLLRVRCSAISAPM